MGALADCEESGEPTSRGEGQKAEHMLRALVKASYRIFREELKVRIEMSG